MTSWTSLLVFLITTALELGCCRSCATAFRSRWCTVITCYASIQSPYFISFMLNNYLVAPLQLQSSKHCLSLFEYQLNYNNWYWKFVRILPVASGLPRPTCWTVVCGCVTSNKKIEQWSTAVAYFKNTVCPCRMPLISVLMSLFKWLS